MSEKVAGHLDGCSRTQLSSSENQLSGFSALFCERLGEGQISTGGKPSLHETDTGRNMRKPVKLLNKLGSMGHLGLIDHGLGDCPIFGRRIEAIAISRISSSKRQLAEQGCVT